MSFLSALLKLFGRRPQPQPPELPPVAPPDARATMDVTIRTPQGVLSGSLIAGEMGRRDWTVAGVPLAFDVLRFTAPAGIEYGARVSLLIRATGWPDLPLEGSLAPSMDVTMPPARRPARTGVVTLQGKSWTDDGGAYYPLGTTLLYGLGHWHRGGALRDLVKENLAYLAAHGYDYARLLCQVNWNGQEIDPSWPGYEQELGALIDCAYDEFGLRIKPTLIGGGAGDVQALASQVRRVVSSRLHKIQMIEAVNEGNASTDDAVAIVHALQGLGLPIAVGLGDQGIETIKDAGDLAGGTVDILHTERGLGSSSEPGGPHARQVRQCWDFHLFARASENGEPPGPASSVATLDDPFQLATFRAASIICGAGAFCLHTGSGVYGKDYDSSAGRRYARLADMPNSDAIFRAVRVADSRLPKGIENWQTFNTNHLVAIDSGEVNKLYGTRNGGLFVEVCLGVTGPVVFRAAEALTVDVINPATGETIATWSPEAGQSARVDGLWAYLLVGHTR
jgi:hypothetical protein